MNDFLLDQLATDIARIADALEVIARHLDPEAAKGLGKRKLPNLRRRLADYAGFDWASIGADVVAHDRYGATEVAWRGVVCKRRSGEDKKGKAIWFNVVTGGTVEAGNITYERLITFRDMTPAEPLGEKVARVIDQAVTVVQNHQAVNQQQPATTQPVTQPIAQPIAQPVTPGVAPAVTTTPSASPVLAPAPSAPTPVPTPITTEIKKFIDGKARTYAQSGRDASEIQRTMVFLLLKEVCGDDTRRHTVQTKLTGFQGFNDIPGPYILALIDWLKPYSLGDKKYHPNAARIQDVEQIVKEALLAAGQQELV